MSRSLNASPSSDLEEILASAQRLGVEIDEEEALQWLAAMATLPSGDDDVIVDVRKGVFGHKVTMLDFDPKDLTHFRRIGKLVEFEDIPGRVETALALSGSAAQSKIQTYPGDADYFERVNILAESREQACLTLAQLIHDKVLATQKGPTYQLIEVKFGSFPHDVILNGQHLKANTPISWSPEEVIAGQIEAQDLEGNPLTITWEQAALDPGWCKLDWVVADPPRGRLANASNMLDVTWEAPDGGITPLDGYLDPYFQEVYLEATSIPIFAKLAKHVSANALDHYVSQLEKEVNKYITKDVNYGKAAKRMYNLFRLTGRYEEAAFLRELFDEPTTLLYQVWSLVRTIEECSNPNSSISVDDALAQADNLILAVVEVLEGAQETEIVRLLLRLRDNLTRQQNNQPPTAEVGAARAAAINLVNNFFYEKLTAVPTIQAYMKDLQGLRD
jgi:hypothetical protein